MIKKLLKDTKAIFGLNAVQTFFSVVLGIALLAYIIVIIMGILGGTTILSSVAGTVTNQRTTSVVTETSQQLPTVVGYNNPICSLTSVVNATSNTAIPTGNYTFTSTGCTIVFKSLTAEPGNFNNSKWNVTYSYTYNSPNQDNLNGILGNTSSGISRFFSNINPIYAILAVLVIILVLVVLVRVVQAPNSRVDF